MHYAVHRAVHTQYTMRIMYVHHEMLGVWAGCARGLLASLLKVLEHLVWAWAPGSGLRTRARA